MSIGKAELDTTSSPATAEEEQMAGDRDDALLMVELAKWGAMIGLPDASRKVFADDFDPEAASGQDSEVQVLLFFNETVGTLVKNGLLNRELVYDWLWVSGSWERVGPAAKRDREKFGVPMLSENFEALAEGQTLGERPAQAVRSSSSTAASTNHAK